MKMNSNSQSLELSNLRDCTNVEISDLSTVIPLEPPKKSCIIADSTDVEDRVRDSWNNKIDFLLACIGFSVGLGNVWRFPYLCYENGGGAFLIPYFVCVAIGGIPIFFLEVALGQFMARGGIELWNVVPLLKGVGCASIIVVFYLNCYYNVILSWVIYYLYYSFQAVLPWSHCDSEWNTKQCSNSSLNSTSGDLTDSSVEFWEKKVLALSSGLHDLGHLKWDLALALFIAWIIVFLCICNGIKTSGKVMYFTATSPYILMIGLLIRAATLEGSYLGLQAYLVPEFSKIFQPKIWADAGTQIFFSYSIGLGTLPALGSFNDFHHNSFRDCLLFAFINSFTSILAGFVIFLTLGYMAHTAGVSVKTVASSGPGLAFIAYPKALSTMPLAPLWSVLFFFMMFLLGLDSQFVGVEGLVTGLLDLLPKSFSVSYYKILFIAFACLLSFIIGLSMVTNGGIYIFQLFDYYTGSRIVLLVALLECIGVAYVYGAERFRRNMRFMYRFDVGDFAKIFWLCISPLFCVVITVLSVITYSQLTYQSSRGTYQYPGLAIVFGWCAACSSITMVPIMMIYKVTTNKGLFMDRIRNLLQPKYTHPIVAKKIADSLDEELLELGLLSD